MANPIELAVLALRETDFTRAARYRKNWAYYKNTPYQLEADREGMYTRVRSIFNQVTKIVDVDTRFTMGEQLQVKAEPRVEAALNKLWDDSDFQREKYLLGRYGACCGDAFLKVVDNRAWELNPDPEPGAPVKMLVLAPQVVTPRYDPTDRKRMVACKIEYVHLRSVYKEVWTPDEVLLYDERDPERVRASYPNELGFIPVVHIKNLDVGEEYGLCSFHNVVPTIDVLNEIASFLVEVVRLYGDPVIVGRGMERGNLRKQTVDADGRPMATVWWVPTPEGSFEFLEWRGNVPDILAFMAKIEEAIQRYVPELVLSHVQDNPNQSGYAVSLQLVELVRKIGELRGNYFAGIKKANEMALRILERQGETAFGSYEHEVVAQPILPADEEKQLRMLQVENQVLKIKSRETVAAERGIKDVAGELGRVDAEGLRD